MHRGKLSVKISGPQVIVLALYAVHEEKIEKENGKKKEVWSLCARQVRKHAENCGVMSDEHAATTIQRII